MMQWFSRAKQKQGWLVIQASEAGVQYVHGNAAPDGGGRAALDTWSTTSQVPSHGGLERLARERHFSGYQCAALLAHGEYQLLLVEAPTVPPSELRSAIRWRIKDMLDYPVDEATLDVLDIPPGEQGGSRAHSMFAVAAKNDIIEQRIKAFEAARIPLTVIDVPETAQRNIAALYETDKGGVALLFLEADSGLLTINYQGELYFTRRLDIGFTQIMKYPAESRPEVFGRIQLELQRTFDHFDRQYSFVSIGKILLGPEPEDSGLADFLAANLGLPVERVDLSERLDVSEGRNFDTRVQWQLFHLVGAALRQETRAP